MKKEIKTRPYLHIYTFAAAWMLWALFLPLFRLWHFIAVFAVSLVISLVTRRLFPGKTIWIEIPAEPFSSGNTEVDELVREGERAISEMQRLRERITDRRVGGQVDEIIMVSDKIVHNLREDMGHFREVRRFLNYYLPTTLKLLHTYDRMGAQGVAGENITGTMQQIEEALRMMIQAYNKQLDALFAKKALDVETDIAVMEKILKKEGLHDADSIEG